MKLLDELRSKDKKGLFTSNNNIVSYSTGILPLDYANGYWQEVKDDNGEIRMVPVLGITAGSFTGIIGNTGTGKTTFADQIAYNIIKPFENSFMIHVDAEKTVIKQRLDRITSGKTPDERVILNNENTSIEDVLDTFNLICETKEAGGDRYKYEVNNMSYDGKPFKMYVPTVFVIDSLPAFNSRAYNKDDLGTNMDPARASRDVSRFYNNCLDGAKKYNILFLTVNHIRPKIETNQFQAPPTGIMMLRNTETLVRGYVSQYLSQNYFRLNTIKSNIYEKDKIGFDGFKASVQIAKTKTNFIGSSIDIAFNKDIGFDPIYSLYEFSDSIGLIQGRNPYLYYPGLDTMKFKRSDFRQKFMREPEFRDGVFKTLRPYLESLLGTKELTEDDKVSYGDFMDIEFEE